VNVMETVTQETALDSRFTEFNIRQDVNHFVRLHDHATKRFESYVRSFGSTLAGGILLGTVDLAEHWSITVKDLTPVLCEHRRDGRSSFVDCPAQCFKNAIRRANQSARNNRTIVGYYRNHTRPEFSLEKEDHDLARKYFAQDARFLLLIKPSPASFSTGVFYLSIDGQLDSERSSVEFPISLKELGAEAPSEQEELERLAAIPSEPVIPQPDPIPVPLAAPSAPVIPVVQAAPAPAPPQAPPASRLSEQFWKGAAAAAILLGSVFAVRSYRAPSSPETGITRPAQVAPASPASPTNPEPARNQAKTAAPAVSRQPATPVESRRADPPAPGVPAKISPAPRVEPQKFVLPAQKKAAPAASVLSSPPEIPPSGMALATPTLITPAVPVPVPVPAPALPVTPALSTGIAPSAPASHPAPEPVRTSPAPATATTAPQGPLSPPHVVLQASPVVPETVKRKLRGDALVRVLVDVDANGKVVNAVSVTQGSKMTQSLIPLAVEAARQSHFEPAKQGDRKVAGQATLQFRFEGEVIRLPVQPSIR
jgi:hypothetical protein